MLRIFRKDVQVLNGNAGSTATDIQAANKGRSYIRFQNISDTTMYLQFGADASATSGIQVAAGTTFEMKGYETGFIPSGRISVYCASTKAYNCLIG